MITCSHCNTENTDEAKFCMACGASLVEEAKSLEDVASQETTPSYEPEPVSPGSYSQPAPSYALTRGYKDRSLALILEILPGLFGILGIGWIYSGKTGGIFLLIGSVIWTIFFWIIAVFTGFFSLLCTGPISITAVIISAFILNKYTKEHPEIFG